jgi:hypothetical protein
MDKKYELVNVSTDNYILKYKDKSFEFKTDVSLVSEMQGIHKKARVSMIKDLAKDGISLKDLSIEIKKDGKTYVDNTNREELENAYIESAMNDFFDNICKDKFDMSLAELLIDIGIVEDTKEVEKFAAELTAALTGSTPSGRK